MTQQFLSNCIFNCHLCFIYLNYSFLLWQQRFSSTGSMPLIWRVSWQRMRLWSETPSGPTAKRSSCLALLWQTEMKVSLRFCHFPSVHSIFFLVQGKTDRALLVLVLWPEFWPLLPDLSRHIFVCIFIRNLTRCINLSFTCILAIHNKSSAIVMRRIDNGININKILSSLTHSLCSNNTTNHDIWT